MNDMIHTPIEHIAIAKVSADENGIAYLTFKKTGTCKYETVPLDQIIATIYNMLEQKTYLKEHYLKSKKQNKGVDRRLINGRRSTPFYIFILF